MAPPSFPLPRTPFSRVRMRDVAVARHKLLVAVRARHRLVRLRRLLLRRAHLKGDWLKGEQQGNLLQEFAQQGSCAARTERERNLRRSTAQSPTNSLSSSWRRSRPEIASGSAAESKVKEDTAQTGGLDLGIAIEVLLVLQRVRNGRSRCRGCPGKLLAFRASHAPAPPARRAGRFCRQIQNH